MEKLYKKIFFEGTLECLSGLHIGDSKDNVEIGGLDSPVVRRKDNNQPYIPGSSLKGKMRSLLQQAYSQNTFKATNKKDVAYFFGAVENKEIENKGHGSRILFRDSYLTKDSAESLLSSPYTDMPYTEQKFENTIDRQTGTTVRGGVRNQERVPAGAKFKVAFVINIIGNDAEEANENETFFKSLFNIGIDLLNNDYIGGSGSRGYGHVNIEVSETKTEDYTTWSHETN